MTLPARLRFLLHVSIACLCLAGTAGAASWKPINPAELAMAAPKIDKTADAEILLWDVRVYDETQGDEWRSTYDHYMRVKIFTDRGREAFARVDIPHAGNVHVYNVEARSVKPDGTFTELKSSDVFERDIVQAGGLKVKATSFPLPGVEKGGIVEYRWRETHEGELLSYLRLAFSRDYPVHSVVYHVKPLSFSGSEYDVAMRALPFHAEFAPPVKEGEYFVISQSDVRAFREEPHSPSEWEYKPWVLVYYHNRAETDNPSQFWTEVCRGWWSGDRKETAPNSAIKAAAKAAVANATTLDQKLAALLAAARQGVKRTDINPVSTGDKKKRKNAKNAGEAFDRGEGRGYDVVNVFIAMARAVELDARPAYLPSRDDVQFDASLMQPYFLDYRVAAVRDGDGWRFLDPSNHFDPAGHLRWTQEGQAALIPDETALTTAKTPQSDPAFSQRKRKATLTLAEDGTLEGDVRNEYTGHLGTGFRNGEYSLSNEERVKRTRDQLVERMPGAEIDKVTIEHVTDTDGPYTLSYHIRVPGYAQRTGSRLFLQPAVFQKGLLSEFPAATRVNPISFDYPWTEHDEVSITLPAGYTAEGADSPLAATLPRVGRLDTKVTHAADAGRLDLVRDLTFGEAGRLLFEPESYAAVKSFFSGVDRHREHTVTLRKKGEAK